MLTSRGDGRASPCGDGRALSSTNRTRHRPARRSLSAHRSERCVRGARAWRWLRDRLAHDEADASPRGAAVPRADLGVRDRLPDDLPRGPAVRGSREPEIPCDLRTLPPVSRLANGRIGPADSRAVEAFGSESANARRSASSSSSGAADSAQVMRNASRPTSVLSQCPPAWGARAPSGVR